MKSALIIFMKGARPGRVKTRLARSMGENRALEIYISLARNTVRAALQSSAVCDPILFIDREEFRKETAEGYGFPEETILVQTEGDLGEKMREAFRYIFNEYGYDKAVIVGTDLPDLNAALIEKAFDELEKTDVVIGPAQDGGYYLLGMKRLHPEIFSGISWSTSAVLRQTLEQIKKIKANYFLLEEKRDIDTEEDYNHADFSRYTGI